MNLLAYVFYFGPFVIMLFDLITARDNNWHRKAICFAALILATIGAFLMTWGDSATWVMAAASQLALINSKWLKGLPRFIVTFASISLICMALGTFAPDIGNPAFGYYEMLYLPANAAVWILPPLIIWYLWHRLPLVFDSLRGGSWATKGVPLLARHHLLAVAMLCSLAINILFYSQWLGQREINKQEINSALINLHTELGQLQNILAYPNYEQDFSDWQSDAVETTQTYQIAANRMTSLVHRKGIANTSALYFLSRTFPEGLAAVLQQTDPQEVQADSKQVATVVTAIKDALFDATGNLPLLKESVYQQAVDQALGQLESTDALNFFEVLYQPR